MFSVPFPLTTSTKCDELKGAQSRYFAAFLQGNKFTR